MSSKKTSSSRKITNLDLEAKELGIGGKFSPENDESLYKKRMQQRKNVQLKRLKERKTKKGLLIVFTGNGKGKTTASLGMALRTIGHGHKVAIIQFIKGGWTTGEEKALKMLSPNINRDLKFTTLQNIGKKVTDQFKRYSLYIRPYDLRHAWAVRTIFYDLPDTVAARMMGHSVSLHTQTYHHWITKRDQQQAVNNALSKYKKKSNFKSL